MTTPSGASLPRFGVSRAPTLVIGIAACVFLLAGFLVTAWLSYHDEIAKTERETRNLALVLREHVQRTIHSVDITLRWTARALVTLEAAGAAPKTPGDLAAFLKRQMDPTAEISNLFLIGPDGISIGDAQQVTQSLGHVDRPYFTAHLGRSDPELFIAEPVLSRTNRGWVVVATRPILGLDGRFVGVVGASVSIDYFIRFYSSLDVADGGTVSLRHLSGSLVARHPLNLEQIGKPGPNTQIVDAVREGRTEGTLTFVPAPGIADRIVSYSAVPGSPFIVSVSSSQRAVTAAWARSTGRYGAVTLALIIAIGGLMWGLTRAARASRRSEQEAAKANRVLADAIEALPGAFLLFDADERLVTINRMHAVLFPEFAGHFVPGARFEDLLRTVHERGHVAGPRGATWYEERAALRAYQAVDTEFQTNDGRWFMSIARRTSDGGRVFMILEITEAKRAQAAVASSEAREREARKRLETILECMPLGCLVSDKDLRMTYWNPAAARIFGCEFKDVRGQTPFETGFILTDRAVVEALHEKLRRGEMTGRSVATNRTRDGRTITCEWTNTPLMGTDGSFQGVLAICQDITERRLTEEALRQSAKMESLGQLTGGVAHDFNNLLLVIMANIDLVEAEVVDRPDLKGALQAALGAAIHGAELTRQLLAFSRRQTLEPKIVQINALVEGMMRLLARTIGETIRVELKTSPDVWPVMVDPTQLESALANLVVNARDAMPEGGKLVIETANAPLDEAYAAHHAEVTAGDYVALSISDTGTGMPPDVVERVFEPFFTTKEVGKGTGLGMSMVFGFVKQSGGHIKIYSEVGMGTTIRLYLPRAAQSPGAASDRASAEALPAAGSGEVILVVEDDADVRESVVANLRRFGYRVLVAADGPGAIEILDSSGRIDLLFTDLVMPEGMNGVELARRARETRPALRVLLTSGYAAPALAARTREIEGAAVLSKPYRIAELARAVREIIDRA